MVGCRESGPGSQTFVRGEKGQPLRIAVIPFTSPANAPDAGNTVTDTVITYLLATGAMEVIEPGMVSKAMRAARYVPDPAGGLDPDTLAVLQPSLNADAYLLGQVEEFGEVRIGPDSYPSVSFSARLVRASDSTIVWAASISRTGADRVKVFDIGRVASAGKLTKSAVAEMADSLRASSHSLLAAGQPSAPSRGAPKPAGPTPGPRTFALNPVFADESRSFGEADLKALAADVPSFSRGRVDYTKHAFDTVTAIYGMEGAGIDVRLVDYRKLDMATQFVRHDSSTLQSVQIDSQTAYSGPSDSRTPGVVHLHIAAGRFGLYLTGPESAAEKMRVLATGLIAAK